MLHKHGDWHQGQGFYSKIAPMKSLLKRFSVALCIGLLAGCAHFTPLAVSTTHLDPDHEVSLGLVGGKAVNNYILGFRDGPEEGMRVAVERAKNAVKADNLINIYVDQRTTYIPFIFLPIFTVQETIVTGTAVKYKTSISSQSIAPAPSNSIAPAGSF